MDRVWRCILAGGSGHGTWLSQAVAAELSFPPAIEVDGAWYMPMTLTCSNSSIASMAGSCVMAHSQATLEQVQEAHQSMLAMAIEPDEAAGTPAQGALPCTEA